MSLLRLLMIRVLTAPSAKLPKLQTFSSCLLVLGCYVVAALAIRALQHNIVTRHNVISNFRSFRLACLFGLWSLVFGSCSLSLLFQRPKTKVPRPSSLLHHFRHCPRSNRPSTFANREPQAFLHGDGRD